MIGLRNAGLGADLLGGMPSGEPSDEVLELTMADALERAVRHNLGLFLQKQRLAESVADRRSARSRLFPSLEAEIRSERDQINFEASPFSRFRPDDAPSGPAIATFDVYDARLSLQLSLFDLPGIKTLAAHKALEQAAEHTTQLIRNAVVLLVGNLYFRTTAAERHVTAATAELTTAEAFAELVDNRLANGLAARMDGLRARSRVAAAKQRRIAAQAELGKARLRLARAIGLPLGQEFELVDSLGYTPVDLDAEDAVALARTQRPDYLQALESRAAAESHLASKRSQRLPRLAIEADVGSIGASTDSGRTTYGAAAVLSVPLYEGGRQRAEVDSARATLDAAEARLRDLETAIHYQVHEALLDERAADAAVGVALDAVEIAEQQVGDARRRFEVGLSSSLEVVEAQEQLANAQVDLIETQLAHRVAKGTIARAVGIPDSQIREILIREAANVSPPSDR